MAGGPVRQVAKSTESPFDLAVLDLESRGASRGLYEHKQKQRNMYVHM